MELQNMGIIWHLSHYTQSFDLLPMYILIRASLMFIYPSQCFSIFAGLPGGICLFHSEYDSQLNFPRGTFYNYFIFNKKASAFSPSAGAEISC